MALIEFKNFPDTSTPINATNLNNNFNEVANIIYPVGSIYMSVNSTSPATLFGGTWEQIKDTFLLACGDTYTNGATGGEATHTLTIDEIPSHRHGLKVTIDTSTGAGNSRNVVVGGGTQWSSNDTIAVNDVGEDQPHNNMPPYLAVYMWERNA